MFGESGTMLPPPRLGDLDSDKLNFDTSQFDDSAFTESFICRADGYTEDVRVVEREGGTLADT
jgi:hypothetical protein